MRAHLKTRPALILSFLFALLAALAPASRATAQCDPPGVTVAVSTTGTFEKSCSLNPVSGRWDLTVTLNGTVSSNPVVTITGGQSVMLGRVRVQNNTALDCRVNIRGTSAIGRIGGIGSFDKGTSGNDKVLLLQLYTAGDVGYDREVAPGVPGAPAIRADMIFNLDIGGSVHGDLVSTAANRSMGNVAIAGSLFGGVQVAGNASLDSLDVGGHIRMPGEGEPEPVIFNIGGHIGRLTAQSIAADITLAPTGVIHHFETTTGDFKGSIHARFLAEFAGTAGNPRFIVARDLDASLTLTDDIRVPVTIGRDFKASRTVGGVQMPNLIWSARGYYDTNLALPAGIFSVAGDFAGSLDLGTPHNVARGSLNRDISIGGSLLGIIHADRALAANLLINGPALGIISVGGSVNAGTMISIGGSGLEGGGIIRIGSSLMGTIALPPGGLMGNILINANNDGSTWSGIVSFGGLNTLNPPPYYENTADLTGGGGVGLAPFGLHSADCQPPHDSAQPVPASAFTIPGQQAVRIHSYGPVQPGPGQTWSTALVIERLDNGNWVNASSLFTPGLYPPGATVSHIVGLAGPAGATPPPAGEYRVRPVGLTCFDVAFAPAVTWPSPDGYRFSVSDDCDNDGIADTQQIAQNAALDGNNNGILDACEEIVTNPCPCDANGDNSLTVADIFSFLSIWFTNSPEADFDGANGVQVADIFAFLSCWFARPEGC